MIFKWTRCREIFNIKNWKIKVKNEDVDVWKIARTNWLNFCRVKTILLWYHMLSIITWCKAQKSTQYKINFCVNNSISKSESYISSEISCAAFSCEIKHINEDIKLYGSNASSTYCHRDVLYFDQLVGQIIKKSCIRWGNKASRMPLFAPNKHSSEVLIKRGKKNVFEKAIHLWNKVPVYNSNCKHKKIYTESVILSLRNNLFKGAYLIYKITVINNLEIVRSHTHFTNHVLHSVNLLKVTWRERPM